jgi:hypothetical protein
MLFDYLRQSTERTSASVATKKQELPQEFWMERNTFHAGSGFRLVGVCGPVPHRWLQMVQRYHSNDERASPSAATSVAPHCEQSCGTLGESG